MVSSLGPHKTFAGLLLWRPKFNRLIFFLQCSLIFNWLIEWIVAGSVGRYVITRPCCFYQSTFIRNALPQISYTFFFLWSALITSGLFGKLININCGTPSENAEYAYMCEGKVSLVVNLNSTISNHWSNFISALFLILLKIMVAFGEKKIVELSKNTLSQIAVSNKHIS